jgi:hypothetical protein
LCARARQRERQQWRFVIIYQVLVLFLAVATAGLLGWLVIHLATTNKPGLVGPISTGLGSLVCGSATRWIERQRRDARIEHKAALRVLEKHGCL